MGSEWRTMTFEEGPLEILDGDRGKNYPKRTEFMERGHCVFLNTGNVTTNGFNFGSVDFISEGRDQLLRKGKLIREDIVLTTRGTVGNAGYYDARIPYDHVRINSGMVLLRPSPEELEPRFLYLFVRSYLFDEQVASLTSGSAQPQLPIRDIKRIEIPLPPLPEQKAIAHILGTLDDKIELNRRMNATLEAMAQALFKSWFVDFDPVIDNAIAAGNPIPDELAPRAEVRKKVLADGTAQQGSLNHPTVSDTKSLFPDAFEFSDELGRIPEGWDVGGLDDVLVLQRGFDLPKAKRTEGEFPLMVSSGQDGTHNESKVSGPGVVTGRSGKLGVVSFVHQDFWPLNTTLWVKQYKRSSPYHAYFLLKTLGLERFNAGSAVATLNRNHISNIVQHLAPDNVVSNYTRIAASLFRRISRNIAESRSLNKLRDTLLPKLISGELHVAEAEPHT